MKERPSPVPDEQSAWAIVFLVGAGLAAIGWFDLLLLFFPPQWASLDWEFGTVSGFIEGLPILTIGLGAMTAASLARGSRRWWRRSLSVAFLLVAVTTVVMVAIFVLDVPAALRAVNPIGKPTLKKAIIKTAMMGCVYVPLYAMLGVWTWRRLRTVKGAPR